MDMDMDMDISGHILTLLFLACEDGNIFPGFFGGCIPSLASSIRSSFF